MMYFKLIDVRALKTHEEKFSVYQSFRQAGWLEFKSFDNRKLSVYPHVCRDYWGICWDTDETKIPEPVYPEIPSNCQVINFCDFSDLDPDTYVAWP